MDNKILPIALIAFGAIIMAYNIFRYFTLVRQFSTLYTNEKRNSKAVLHMYTILLIFFLIGYLVVGISMSFPSNTVSNMLVGLIFFFGSIFVMIGLNVILAMSRTIQKSNIDITQALIAAVEARDENLNGHSIHVARLVMLLYNNISRKQQQAIKPDDLEYAALLHDIGKLGVPERVLNKVGSLESDEWAEIRKHTQIGKNILSRIDCFKEISDWVLYHHERCDGLGYLSLLKEEIPYPSLMIAVVDTYSAITMKRSYRDGRSHSQAVEVLKDISGAQLDKELVDIFIKIPEEELKACMPVEYELEEAALILK